MAIQKKVNGTWQPITPKKLKGVPYTGTLPATLTGTKAGYLHRYKIYGNTEQTGTPTPENPIVPSECGERTENLFDKSNALDGRRVGASGEVVTDSSCVLSDFIRVDANTIYTQSTQFSYSNAIAEYDESKVFIIRYISGTGTFTTTGNTRYIRVSSDKTLVNSFMLVPGSTAPTSYIPYGYKLPLTAEGQGVDIYLGESQTTRRIKKLVLTGKESWNTQQKTYYIRINNYYRMYDVGSHLSACSHYPNSQQYGPPEKCYGLGGLVDGQTSTRWNGNIVFNPSPTISSRTDWISYLAAQYAAGTPVTVWYVLNNPETGTLNEPLRKIGDYADTIDSTQTTAQIPTSAGSTTISWAGEGLAPSEFDSIQEWVDIPTYTRVNGEWVADN